MWRFVLILLLSVAIAPIAAKVARDYIAEQGASEIDDEADVGGERRHAISASANGQFFAEVRLNGREVKMLVDTGASATVLPESVAEKIGIYLRTSDYKHSVKTANGVTAGAAAVIDDISIGSIRLNDIQAIVLEDRSLGIPLLGMTALGQLKRFDISEGNLVLVQ